MELSVVFSRAFVLVALKRFCISAMQAMERGSPVGKNALDARHNCSEFQYNRSNHSFISLVHLTFQNIIFRILQATFPPFACSLLTGSLQGAVSC
jgi:hypothetical protein